MLIIYFASGRSPVSAIEELTVFMSRSEIEAMLMMREREGLRIIDRSKASMCSRVHKKAISIGVQYTTIQ